MKDSMNNRSAKKSSQQEKYKDLQQKIFSLLDKEKSPEEINLEKAKEAYRKEYKRQKNQEYKSKWVRETIRFTPREIEELSAIAKKYGLKRSPFLKACIYGYLQDSFILPNDTKVRTLELGMNQIANTMNETIRYIHQNGQISLADIEKIKSNIKRLELVVSSTLRTPPNLQDWIEEHIQADPNFIKRLQRIINQIDHDY
ncbi:MAG: hypothetical protein ACPG6V_09670 [Flavobacteriales bacterium]